MIATGLWFLTLLCLALASVLGIVRMILARHFIHNFVIIIAVFVVASSVQGILLLNLQSHVASYKNFWAKHQQTTPNELVYVALGDSAAQGIGASTPNAAYVKILATTIEARTGKPVKIINLSKSGANIKDLIREQLPMLHGLHPDILTVDIGSNDIVQGTSQADMASGYKEIIRTVSPHPVVFANLPDFMWGTQQRNTIEINKTIVSLCRQYGVEVADLHHATHRRMWAFNEFAPDGFHPSDNGYRTWAGSFVPGVQSILTRTNTEQSATLNQSVAPSKLK
jgi:acyl-CoA thioesterase-1